MRQEIEKAFKNCNLKGSDFGHCITDASWLVARWNVYCTDTRRRPTYVFGTDVMLATGYDQKHPTFPLSDLAYATLIKELEKNPDEIKPGFFRFEFDGEKFNFCEQEPIWAKYDCGILEN